MLRVEDFQKEDTVFFRRDGREIWGNVRLILYDIKSLVINVEGMHQMTIEVSEVTQIFR